MSGYTFEKHSHYCVLQFTPELLDMAWSDVEESTKRVTELVHDSGTKSVLVDLSTLENMPSGVVASLVRTWKGMDEKSRKFVVVSAHDNVTRDLEQTGLTSLWTITPSVEQAYKVLGVSSGSTADDEDEGAVAANAADDMEPLVFTEQRLFCSVRMNPILMSLEWADVEAATTDVLQKIRQSEHNSVLVDISPMEMINSGLVALLVRIWKETQESKGQFSLVSPNEMVTGVLKSAGLWKLWSVVDDRDEGVYDLGVSKGAQVEERERRILVTVAVPCAILAVLALIPMFFERASALGVNAQQAPVLFAAAAVATGAISVLKDRGVRRQLSAVSVIVGLGVLGTLWFRGNPVQVDSSEANSNQQAPVNWTEPNTSGGGLSIPTSGGEGTQQAAPAAEAAQLLRPRSEREKEEDRKAAEAAAKKTDGAAEKSKPGKEEDEER